MSNRISFLVPELLEERRKGPAKWRSRPEQLYKFQPNASAEIGKAAEYAKVPVILTSRTDSVRSRIASCAVAMLAAHARRQTTGKAQVSHG
jgi:hypothetical protein